VRRSVAVIAACAAAAVAAGIAGATDECRGLQVCVPVAGPWVVTAGAAEVQYQLACPRRFVVAGLDAELSRRGLDIGFRGALGSPVNPGITTSSSALFVARVVSRPAAGASFRPHIGCVPASGGGQRFPTAYRVLPPGKPIAPTMVDLPVVPGVHRFVEACPAQRRLVDATHAIGFYTTTPPAAAVARSVAVAQTIRSGRLHLTVRAGRLPGVNAVVQVDLLCAAAA
jgi:hypothetical protein